MNPCPSTLHECATKRWRNFAGSAFSYKPSAIVAYSAGRWGGTRAAVALRPVLSELGCLPVSAMVQVARASDVFDEDGEVVGGEEKRKEWERYAGRTWSQLEWWGMAARDRKQMGDDPFKRKDGEPFVSRPRERDSPQ